MRNHKENSDLNGGDGSSTGNLAKMEPPENNNKISVVSKLLLKDSNGNGNGNASRNNNINSNSNSNASFSSASVAGSVQVSLKIPNRFRVFFSTSPLLLGFYTFEVLFFTSYFYYSC